MLVSVKNDLMNNEKITMELYEKFIDYLDVSPKTLISYKKSLKQFFVYLHSNDIKSPTNKDIRAYRDYLIEKCKPATTQAYIFIVRRFFEWAETNSIYPNVAGKIKGAKISRDPKKDYLTSNQAKNVITNIDLDNIEGLRNYAIISLMLTCGLRTIEISRANTEDIRTVADNKVIFVQGKGENEKAESVIITAPVEKAIYSYLKTRKNAKNSDPLFISYSNNSKGKRLTTRSISSIAKKSMQKVGYDSEKLTAHSFRHTAVTLALIGNGGNIQEAQQFARHKNINTTLIYAHNLEKQNNKCSKLVTDAIFN